MRNSARTSSRISCLAAGLACLLALSAPFHGAQAAQLAQADGEEEVTYLRVVNLRPGNVLWLRAGPTVRSPRVGFLRYNDRFIRSYGCKTFRVTWCEVIYRGTRGWASKLYLAEDTARQARLQ